MLLQSFQKKLNYRLINPTQQHPPEEKGPRDKNLKFTTKNEILQNRYKDQKIAEGKTKGEIDYHIWLAS